MNKQVVKIVSLVAGILAAIVAVFLFVFGILCIQNFSNNAEAKWNVYNTFLMILYLAAAAGIGLFGALIIINFVKGSEDDKFMSLPALVAYAFYFISTFIAMCFWGFDTAAGWVVLIFYCAAIALLLVAKFANLNKLVSGILVLVAIGIGFVFSIYDLTQTGGVGIALGIFEMFMFIAIFLYYLFKMIVDGTFNGSKSE